MDPFAIIDRYYKRAGNAREILLRHGEAVAKKALLLAERVGFKDTDFIHEAAILHDIGIIKTRAPEIFCYGESHYLCHGYLGKKMLDSCGLARHALVCERHVGVGILKDEIKDLKLPLPARDMVPVLMEEIIVCYADKFFSKGADPEAEKPFEEVLATLGSYGRDKAERFLSWHRLFSG